MNLRFLRMTNEHNKKPDRKFRPGLSRCSIADLLAQ